jgi:cytochrome P450
MHQMTTIVLQLIPFGYRILKGEAVLISLAMVNRLPSIWGEEAERFE